MKLERVDCYGMEMWIVTGEPLPPPRRGTHCFHTAYQTPRDARHDVREGVAFRWSRGEL